MDESGALDHTGFVAMDAHARSITAAALDTKAGQASLERPSGCPTAQEVVAWAKARTPGGTPCACESGPTRFGLCRDIRRTGHGCGAAAVSSLARPGAEKTGKADAGDAKAPLADIPSPMSHVSVFSQA